MTIQLCLYRLLVYLPKFPREKIHTSCMQILLKEGQENLEPGLVPATITGPGDQETGDSPYWLSLGQLGKLKKQHCLFVNEHTWHELKKWF